MNHRIRKSNLAASSTRKRRSKAIGRTARLLGCFLLTSSIILAGSISLVEAQSGGDPSPVEAPAEVSPRPMQPSAQPQTFALPNITTPTVAPAEAGQYVLEFNRSPVVGSSLRLQSIYDEARLRFTRPRNWEAESVKVLLRFRHSAALYASRSNLTVLVNGTSVGSVPLNKPQGEIGSVVFDVPTDLIQDHNEVVIAALQNNSPTCTQDPYDPSLWTEILPDSKVVFDYEPQPIALDFSRYPFPVYDTLSLQGNQLAYLLPETIDETWLTATSRYHTSLGRIAEYRSLDTRLISSLNEVEDNERLVVIGTPAEQPDLANLDLPLPIQNDRILDAQQQALPPDVGVLMLATAAQDQVPVLIATGNSPEGVAKAAQFLAQSQDQKIGTGSVIYVNQVTEVPTPSSREWAGYLPLTDSFQLSDLRTYENQSFQDVTVRGSHAPALEFDFRALPDDQFLPGSSMVLRYSYSPQVNPVTSLVEVELDNIPIDGRRLSSVNGATQQEFRLDLPDRIRPDSKMQINFRLDPRERRACSRVTDQQLWGTIHADTSFSLNRQNVVNLPNLDLFRFGYPFASPQDLSTTAIVIPDNPTAADLELLLETSERLGRLSKAESVKLNVYRTGQLPPEVRSTAHLIGIGTQAQFPFPEAFQEEDGFNLNTVSLRQWQQSQIQSTPDEAGVAKQIVSPWNSERVLLALSSQSPEGLGRVRELLAQDPLFYQLQGDTVLISANTETPSPYDANDYNLQFLSLSPQQQIIGDQRSWWLLFRSNWLVLAPALVLAALLLYGVSQLYLQRVSPSARS